MAAEVGSPLGRRRLPRMIRRPVLRSVVPLRPIAVLGLSFSTTTNRNRNSSCSYSNSNSIHNENGDMIVEPESSSSSFSGNTCNDASSSSWSVEDLLRDLEIAATWVSKSDAGKTPLDKVQFCRNVVQRYDAFLKQSQPQPQPQPQSPQQPQPQQQPVHAGTPPPETKTTQSPSPLLSPESVIFALKALLKCRFETAQLSPLVRHWERTIGRLQQTPFTDHVSLRFLTAHAKAGNVASVIRLLQLRQQRHFPPRPREFVFAVTAIQAAPALQRHHRSHRNPYRPEVSLPALERNPTRWLDAILRNMHERQVPLTTELANHMLQCFSITGYSGKATHHFYRIKKEPIMEFLGEGNNNNHVDSSKWSDMPRAWYPVVSNSNKPSADQASSNSDKAKAKSRTSHQLVPVKIRLHYHAVQPPFPKRPSDVKGKLIHPAKRAGRENSWLNSGVTPLDFQRDPLFSETLTAASVFADSLQHGAFGHDPVQFNTGSYNALIKACVKHGAIWRAMHLIDHVMPQNQCPPTTFSYNLLLAGLARVGDVATAQEYYYKMLSSGSCTPDAYTVKALVDGQLNFGDVPGAVTTVQDIFHQHCVLPYHPTHLKVLEFCLAQDLIHEAKRYVYFLQELWHWKPNKYHSKEFIQVMQSTQRNKHIQKPALQKLFRYYGESLEESDFLK